MKKVLLAPLDPVHDNAIKLLKRKLSDCGYEAITMRPGVTEEEVVQRALRERPAAILVSRTLGYRVAETLGRLVDLAEAAGLRESTKLGVGGMAITRETGSELGFDATFSGDLDMQALLAFLEGTPGGTQVQACIPPEDSHRTKPDILEGYSFKFKDKKIEALLDQITEQLLAWAEGKTSAGIQRAQLRCELIVEVNPAAREKLLGQYVALCDAEIQAFYRQGKMLAGVRRLDQTEVTDLPQLIRGLGQPFEPLRHVGARPLFFSQYGTGCPVMDVIHIKTAEAWGADGILHFDPSWGAQHEGLLDGLLSHEHDGTILTLDNLRLIHRYTHPATLWTVRGHRGLNTPETQVLGRAAGADLFKINIPYGSTGGGTDPERLAVDGIYSLRLAAKYGIPFDIPGNDELSGVPPHKTFAGILVMAMLGLKLGAKPIAKPLLCYSPYLMVSGEMENNFVDMNAAKLAVWPQIADLPVWAGEPVGFMTHTPERVQSSVTTAAHAALAAGMGVAAVTIASSDEAYSKGPISAQARVDSLRAVRDLLRFTGSAGFQPSAKADQMQAELYAGIIATLEAIAARGDFVAAIYEGLLGSQEDGLYPGRTGRGTIAFEG